MCGLTGFARHPKGKNRDTAWQIFEMMMLQIRHRGTHATGIAVQQGDDSFIWKKAAPVDKVLNSNPWKNDVTKLIRSDVTVVQGHVRFATHNNAHLDDAAHPFVEGKITGCHNGIIRNWRTIASELKRNDMINDSQVPFAMLNNFKNPAKALDTMDGYWALTWTKGASVFMCRTNDAQLAAAYVPEMQTLFWNSEAKILRATLIEAGIASDDFDMWEVKPSTIYRYTPDTFDAKGTNGDKVDAPFRGRNVRQHDKFDGAHSTVTTWKNGKSTTHNVSGQTTFSNGTGWDGVNAREIDVPDRKRYDEATGKLVDLPRRAQKALSAGQITLKDIDAKITDMFADVYREIDSLKAELTVAKAEVDFLRVICDDAGLLNETTIVETDETDEETTILAEADGFDCDACVTCPACKKPLSDESMEINGEVNLSSGGECGLVHTKCLFTDGHTEANRNASTVA